jgi:hypothetical protein
MPEQNIVEHSLDIWQVNTLRMTAFPSPAAQITEPTWWADLIAEPPEKRISQPRRGEQREEGSLAKGKLTLGVGLIRIDWVYTVADDPKFEVEGFPTAGTLPEALETFRPLMHRWFALDTCPPIQRLAFGAILWQPAKNLQTGYRQLVAYLPAVTLDSEGSSDFFYQINRPRASNTGIADLRINRLSKWSVTSLGSAAFAISTPGIAYIAQPTSFACQVELDINTVPEFRGEFTGEQLPQIFAELVDLGCEIASRGDMP